MGTTASTDGQFYAAGRRGEALNAVNARHGNDRGTKDYIHVNDRVALFSSRTIPATISEATYLLDELTMNEASRQSEEQYADTSQITDHLLGISAILGYRLVLRIRDLPSKWLFLFATASPPADLRQLVASKAREALIGSDQLILFRCAASMSAE